MIFVKKGNVHRFCTSCAIETIDHFLGKQFIIDFRKRKLGDLKAYNFVYIRSFEKSSFDHVTKMMTSFEKKKFC